MPYCRLTAPNGIVSSYLHVSPAPGLGRIGALVSLEGREGPIPATSLSQVQVVFITSILDSLTRVNYSVTSASLSKKQVMDLNSVSSTMIWSVSSLGYLKALTQRGESVWRLYSWPDSQQAGFAGSAHQIYILHGLIIESWQSIYSRFLQSLLWKCWGFCTGSGSEASHACSCILSNVSFSICFILGQSPNIASRESKSSKSHRVWVMSAALWRFFLHACYCGREASTWRCIRDAVQLCAFKTASLLYSQIWILSWNLPLLVCRALDRESVPSSALEGGPRSKITWLILAWKSCLVITIPQLLNYGVKAGTSENASEFDLDLDHLTCLNMDWWKSSRRWCKLYVIAEEEAILREQLAKSRKPAAIQEKIIAGKMNKVRYLLSPLITLTTLLHVHELLCVLFQTPSQPTLCLKILLALIHSCHVALYSLELARDRCICTAAIAVCLGVSFCKLCIVQCWESSNGSRLPISQDSRISAGLSNLKDDDCAVLWREMFSGSELHHGRYYESQRCHQ